LINKADAGDHARQHQSQPVQGPGLAVPLVLLTRAEEVIEIG
jgi:hypothetical protein